MGIETALMAAQIAASIYGGIQQSRAASEQSELAMQDAEARAREEARLAIGAEERQKLGFLKSGVQLEGSPLLLLAETRRRGLENVQNVIRSGEARASAIRSEGRKALFSGFSNALTAGVGLAGKIGGGGGMNPPLPQRKPPVPIGGSASAGARIGARGRTPIFTTGRL